MSSLKVPIDNTFAKTLKSLHVPGNPVVFANTYDPASTTSVLALNTTNGPPLVQAIATASYAIAGTLGIADPDLTLKQNLSAVAAISPLVRAASLPLSVDLQDGYGENLKLAVTQAIEIGAAGANIEDSYPDKGFANGLQCLKPVEEQVLRIKEVLAIAKSLGLPDFVINARTDVNHLNPKPDGWGEEQVMEEVVRRGKAYLEAGATCVFVWSGLSRAQVELLVKEFGGRVAVKLDGGKDGLSVKELAEIGVCRISVGPSLWMESLRAVRVAAERILGGGQLWAGQ